MQGKSFIISLLDGQERLKIWPGIRHRTGKELIPDFSLIFGA
jgi:hypothetical protein